MKVNRSFSRGFLVAASAYRRHASGFAGDFSESALLEQFDHETHGSGVSEGNGFAFGKSALNITLAAMREDFADGLFTKHELLRASSAFVRREVRNWTPVPFLGYSR